MDRGACRATVHRIAKSQTWLKWLRMHTCGVIRFPHVNFEEDTNVKPITANIISILFFISINEMGLPWWLRGKEPTCQCRRYEFNSWIRKIATHSSIHAWEIPWTEGTWQAPGHGVMKELDTTERLKATTNITKVSAAVVVQKEQGVRD